MKIANIFAVIISLALLSFAEFIKNPDDNTLWLENGKDISGWREALKMTALPEGGFTVEVNTANAGGRYVPVSPQYPWLVANIAKFERVSPTYINFGISGCFDMINNPMPGIFTVKMKPVDKDNNFLRMDIYGLRVTFKELKAVKTPENYIEAVMNGDDLDVTVHLKAEAEDVSVSFYASYMMIRQTINNSMILQLLPVDEENPVLWKGTVKNFKNNVKHCMLLKATVLGSDEIKVPIWGVAPR